MQKKKRVNSPLSETELQEILQHNNTENDTFVVDNNMNAYCVHSDTMPGKCIVDFVYILEQLHDKFEDHCRGIECSFRDLTFICARSYGLKNRFFFKCRICNFESDIWSEPSSEESFDINTEVMIEY